MCGIIGVFNLNGQPALPVAELRAGLARMVARGPDDQGLHQRPGLALGHRRLAIIDLQDGRQPMRDTATGVTLIFNGEIFNYRKLRAQLTGRGHAFATQSDTEVLLRAYLEWGRTCLDRLVGMFALAIHDPRSDTILLARDRIGVKPLFFACRNHRFYFASSIPAIRCFKDLRPDMDLAAVSHYLTTIRTTLGARTMLRDIRALLPGEYLEMRRHTTDPVIRRYWDYPILAAADKTDPGLAEATGQTAALLENAVKEQLISDVPLGGFLSGGLDSSIIAGLAHRLTAGHFDAYGIGYDLEGYNEWSFIRTVAQHYGLRCRETHADPMEYAGKWRHLTGIKGLPVSTPNEILIYQLARALRSEFTVALSGEGADEIFGGYIKTYFSAHDYERARRDPPRPGEPLTELDRALQRLYRRPYLLCRADHFFLHCSWMPFRQKRDLLQPSAWQALEADRNLFAFYDDWFAKLETCSTFDAYMHLHARINLEGLLFRVDSSTMAASVEARVPFTDHRLAEYLFSLPDHYKINWRHAAGAEQARNMNILEIDEAGLVSSKILLREAFAGDIPQAILDRPKMSFPVPVLEWFTGALQPLAAEVLRESDLARQLFRQDRLQRLLETAAYPPSATALWPIVNLCLWQMECGAVLP